MRHHPRPPPRIWPIVIATLLGVGILLSLGVWQVQRLHWKQGLLAELAAKLHSYYNAEKFLVEDEKLKLARLALIVSTRLTDIGQLPTQHAPHYPIDYLPEC